MEMQFLISNDDGISAEGIQVLSEAMRALGAVTIVAPDRDRSGASNSLTLGLCAHCPDRIAGSGSRHGHFGHQ
jgi:5'/3'-nucleotidase SurE